MIEDKDVLKEYFKETGGPDGGLVVLDSLNEWRHNGWKVGKHTYKIQAFAQVDVTDKDEVRQAIFGDVGLGFGVQLSNSAKTQIQTGQEWDVTTGRDSKPALGAVIMFMSQGTPRTVRFVLPGGESKK